jgi:hypothetical protein
MKGIKVGVLEILTDSVGQDTIRRFWGRQFRRHYASIMPQAISVWCRELGADVTYATYYGQQDPHTLLPDQLNVLFIATSTSASAIAYAVSKIFRRRGTLTVIGGPHARSFPTDCHRFFDLVVRHCDKAVVSDILRGAYDRGTLVSSARPPIDLPSVEERLPEIVCASLTNGERPTAANVPLVSSVGCPYTCDFCSDWNNAYILMPPERLHTDLKFIAKRWPGVWVAYHDPNFGVSFDPTLAAIERLPEHDRNPYFMESSLSILKGPRLKRLKATNCLYVATGIESWGDYSNKAGVGARVGADKLAKLVDHFSEIREHVPNMQANFIFGTDADAGDDPVELTEEFMRRVPHAWPYLSIPTPFGSTPLYDRQLAEGRILRAMPFSFYYTPYLVMTLKNYTPLEYYDRMVRLHASAYSWRTMFRRAATTSSGNLRVLNVLRTFGGQVWHRRLRAIRARLRDDAGFRAFHEGGSHPLPLFYRDQFARRLGSYASLLSAAEMTPEPEAPAPTFRRVATQRSPSAREPRRVAEAETVQ